MTDREILEIIPEPLYRDMLAWLAAGHTGTITLDVVAGRVVRVECVAVRATRPGPAWLRR